MQSAGYRPDCAQPHNFTGGQMLSAFVGVSIFLLLFIIGVIINNSSRDPQYPLRWL